MTVLIVIFYRSKSGHTAANFVCNELRERFHIIGQQQTVKHYIKSSCALCRNRRANVGGQLMAPLADALVESAGPVFKTAEQCAK